MHTRAPGRGPGPLPSFASLNTIGIMALASFTSRRISTLQHSNNRCRCKTRAHVAGSASRRVLAPTSAYEQASNTQAPEIYRNSDDAVIKVTLMCDQRGLEPHSPTPYAHERPSVVCLPELVQCIRTFFVAAGVWSGWRGQQCSQQHGGW